MLRILAIALLLSVARAADPDGTTGLHWAVHNDEIETVRTLLGSDADPNKANNYHVTPLSLACTNGNNTIITALLDAGADPNTTLPGGETALMTAARTGLVAPVRTLLDRGAKIDATTDRTKQTALVWAAAEGNDGVVRLLLDRGADHTRRLGSGFTPMLFAARNGHADVVHTLIAAGCSPDEAIKTTKGGGRNARNRSTALVLAVENGHFELAVELVKAGADPNHQRSGFTPLHILSWVRKPSRGDDPSGMPPPEGSGKVTSLGFARALIALGADVNARLDRGPAGAGRLSHPGATPFLFAAKNADLDYMQLLVGLKADPLLPNHAGTTPVMAAAGIGCRAPDEEAGTEDECVAAVAYLLSLGADLNTIDKHGETAMHGAAYKSLPKMVAYLDQHGASFDLWNQKNQQGRTPVMIAEGFRPGNFKPSVPTLKSLQNLFTKRNLPVPSPTPRPTEGKRGYEAP
ncbi:MAG: ankyrin repeat domain-containing protein [Verrucomicrobiales bacterium]|nr:ankyrin repeat domain-containing protein [Verrucomicrobiales bacterium]